MQQWFKGRLGGSCEVDFLEFDGNAQTFRLLTRLQVLSDQFGLNLTFGTLATLLKYPSVYGSANKGGFKKWGVFVSEADIAGEVWKETGLAEGIRHPLAYIVEACDDIAYSIIDAEDTVKKGYASFYDLMDFLKSFDSADASIDRVVTKAREKNAEFKKYRLSSRELNDISMQMFRVKAIKEMVDAAVVVFTANVEKFMSGTIPEGFELIRNSSCAHLCTAAKRFDFQHGFQHRDVLRLELEGSNYIKNMMTMLWSAIDTGGKTDSPFERYMFGEISENYRRVYQDSTKTPYAQRQLLCDAVAGMTENYLIKKHNEFKSLKNSNV